MKPNHSISMFFFFFYFGLGGFYPLLSVYLRDTVGLSGTQIGLILSIIPLITIVAQPAWGFLSDLTQKPTGILAVTILAQAISVLILSSLQTYALLLMLTAMMAIAQSANIPLSDSIALGYCHRSAASFGALRLWGSVGFATASLLMGWVSHRLGFSGIFSNLAIALVISGVFARRMPMAAKTDVRATTEVKKLLRDRGYTAFLLATILILGPIQANETYFGLLLREVGGSLSAVGLAFFLGVGAEVPVMRFSGGLIQRYGTAPVMGMAALVSGGRWFYYCMGPSTTAVLATAVAQGLSVGLFIPAALQFARTAAPRGALATAVTLYSSSASIGNSLCIFLGGALLEGRSIFSSYLFFGALTALGLLILVFLTPAKRVP